MRFRIMILALATFLGATGAFAADTTAVNIPFSFESRGQQFPASQYEIKLSGDRHHLTISSRQTPAKSMFLVVNWVDINQHDPNLSIRFETAGGLHELSSIRLGTYEYKH
jgi:hypothetical protein